METLAYLAQKSGNASDSDSTNTSDSDSTAEVNTKEQGDQPEPPSGNSTGSKAPGAKSLVIRRRKEDPLPYSMVNEKNSVADLGGLLYTSCPTCGPPFP